MLVARRAKYKAHILLVWKHDFRAQRKWCFARDSRGAKLESNAFLVRIGRGHPSVFLHESGVPMKIAQIAPLAERCPPSLYGGTERIVSYLTEELVRQGHDVTLLASGDSATRAELVPCCDMALRLDTRVRDPLPYYVMMLDRVMARASSYDALHFHIDLVHFPLLRQTPVRAVRRPRQNGGDFPDFRCAISKPPRMRGWLPIRGLRPPSSSSESRCAA
ncbi:STRUCTURAL ELEMENT (plasmid) [Cupriavidus necator H850]|nr:STRUCTURAL ELEMENT [Cupriavidus necator H850]